MDYFIIGSKKYERKNSLDNSYTLSGLFLGILSFIFILSIVALNLNKILNYYGVDYEKYSMIYIFGIINLLFDFIVLSLKLIIQYNNKSAFNLVFLYYGYKIVLLFIMRLISDSINLYINILIITLIIVFISALVICLKDFKFRFSFINSLKYSILSIPENIGMLLIYGLGLSNVTGSELFLNLYNMMAMCTDTQWDVLASAIDTDISVKACEGKFCKRDVINSLLYALLLWFSSLIMILLSYRILPNLSIKYMMILFILETIQFPVYGIRYALMYYTNIMYPTKALVIINMISYIIRVFISLCFKGCYILSIAVFITGVINNTCYIVLYFVKKRSYKASP